MATPRHPFARRRRRALRPGGPVLLVGTGAAADALRPVLLGLPDGTDLVVLLRLATRQDVLGGAELAEQTLRRGGRLVELSGPRSAVALDGERLRSLVPDLGERAVHAAGPRSFVAGVLKAAAAAGAPCPSSPGSHSRLSGSSKVLGRS